AARALLAARTAPIAEIAQFVGFRTPSHFTTTFRRVTGMTPRAYRSEAGVVSVGSTSVAATGFGATAARAADREIRRARRVAELGMLGRLEVDRKSTRLNSSHDQISYA